MAASTGAGTKELMYRLAHASPQAVLRYQHATRERDTAIADAMGLMMRAARPAANGPEVAPAENAAQPSVTEVTPR